MKTKDAKIFTRLTTKSIRGKLPKTFLDRATKLNLAANKEPKDFAPSWKNNKKK